VAARERVREDHNIDIFLVNNPFQIVQFPGADCVGMLNAVAFLNDNAPHIIANPLSHSTNLIRAGRAARQFGLYDNGA
jgi:hypothetical protein